MKKHITISGLIILVAILGAAFFMIGAAGPSTSAGQPIGVSADQVAQRIAYDGSNRIQYIGECLPQFQNRGTALRWRIKLIQYDGASTRITSVTWASNDADYIHAWNSRATYTY